MKKTVILTAIVMTVILLFTAAAGSGERSAWDCPNPECGRKGNTGAFCGGCGYPAPDAIPDAAETPSNIPEGYPAVIEGLDFGGQEVFIYDWYSDGTRNQYPNKEQQLQYDYWDWLQETYNVTVTQIKLADWFGMPTELAAIAEQKDNSRLCIVSLGSGFASQAIADGLFMPWTYGLDQDVFNVETVQFMSRNGVCYGVSWGTEVEPRQGVFFNKRILEEAKIDWNEIYDAQADGTWTWDKMEEYMDKVQRSGDGKTDIWALTGNRDDVTVGLVVSNEADFFKVNINGKLLPAIRSADTKEALEKRIEWGKKYLRPYSEWDDYKRFWAEGNVAFMIGQAYEGFAYNSTVGQIADGWGFVAMPKGPRSDRYVSAADNNVYGIPNAYDEATALKLEQIFTLWTSPVPGADQNAWAEGMDQLTDNRAIYETYAMLRQNEHACIMNYLLLGDRDSVASEVMLWLDSGYTADEIIDFAQQKFQERCDQYNSR